MTYRQSYLSDKLPSNIDDLVRDEFAAISSRSGDRWTKSDIVKGASFVGRRWIVSYYSGSERFFPLKALAEFQDRATDANHSGFWIAERHIQVRVVEDGEIRWRSGYRQPGDAIRWQASETGPSRKLVALLNVERAVPLKDHHPTPLVMDPPPRRVATAKNVVNISDFMIARRPVMGHASELEPA